MIARTGAILFYGQVRASVSPAIARRVSLPSILIEFPALTTAPALLATHLDAGAVRSVA